MRVKSPDVRSFFSSCHHYFCVRHDGNENDGGIDDDDDDVDINNRINARRKDGWFAGAHKTRGLQPDEVTNEVRHVSVCAEEGVRERSLLLLRLFLFVIPSFDLLLYTYLSFQPREKF